MPTVFQAGSFPDYLFKDVCLANSLGRYRRHLHLEQRAGMLISPYTIFSFPNFLSYKRTSCVFRHCLALFASPCENWGLRNHC